MHKSSFERWLSHQDRYIQSSSSEDQQRIYSETQKYIQQLSRKKNITIKQDFTNQSLKAFVLALRTVSTRLGDSVIRLSFHSEYNNSEKVYYRIVNENTLDYLDDLILFENYELRDSFDDFVNAANSINRIDIEFAKRKPENVLMLASFLI